MITATIQMPVHELVNAMMEDNPGMTAKKAKKYIFKNLVLVKGDYVQLELVFHKPE